DEVPTASEKRIPLLSKRDAHAEEVCTAGEVKEVIEFGDSYEAPQKVSGIGSASEGSAKKKGRTVAVTIKDMQKRRNDVKARTTLFLALPYEHQLRFSKYKTAQELWAAIMKIFGGNEATKKTMKNQLKQQYSNFKAEGTETLEQSFNRLQAIVSHLEVMDVEIEQDDLNQKFLTSLAPEWLIANVVAASISHDTVYAYIASQSNGSQIKYEDINQIDEDDSGKKITIQGTDVAGFDKSKVECFNCHKMGHFARKCKAPRSQDRDWSYMENEEENHALVADEEAPTEFALMAKSSSENKVFDNSLCSKSCKKNTDSLNTKITELSEKLSDTKNNLYHYKLVLFPPPAQVYSPPKIDMSWTGLPEFADDTITDYSRPSRSVESNSSDLQNSSSSVSENEESSKSIMSKPMIKFVKATDSPTIIKTNKVETIRKPSVKYAEMYRNTTKSPKGNSQNIIDDKGYWDSGCSRYMTGNISHLSDYEPYDGGYVSFGQGGGKITGKGIIKIGKLEFENVYFVKDIKYNLFSVSQICDNKNNVLFTDSECIMLGRDFKLKDDTNVLLKTPRQHNMYSIDLNNIVPHKDLTCLVAKASFDECMLWHRRLGHLNFNIMNKLVRHNLVKGLPSKCFKNNHTCVACLKGKQHKASCKTKLVNSVTKPLHTLHMDLFGPTSVSSLNHKWYCLVVTDDFSRFTLTFFIKTKDETSGILRNFITEIENLKELKVKIIRCDNGGEFRNKGMNDFCSRKRIKREFNNAKTPQQNRVAEKRNKTLIEAARTMLADAKLPVTFWAEAVNTACYVQNEVLVNKSQNKSLYELFNCRTHAIGFLKPFGCHVMIINTLDNLEKFDAKRDEGYFIGYSMSSKAFRVFNKRIKRVEENLHVDFLENKLIEKGAGPNWLFDIDTLTNSMNYVPVVVAGTSSTNFSGTKDATSQDVKKDVSSLRYISLPNWFHEAHLEPSTSNAQDACNADAPESSRISNPTVTSTNPLADQIETLTVESAIPTVPTACLVTLQNTQVIQDSSQKGLSDGCEKCLSFGTIDEEVYVMQPPGFQDLEFPARVYKVEKAMSRTAKTFDLVWMWLDGDYGNLFLMGYTGIQWIETMDEGTNILATVDGKLRTIYESSIRRNLKLNDEEGISTLPDAELFENLVLMGYNNLPNQKFTFQKGHFSHQWKYLIYTIMQCLSPKSTGFNEFSSNIAIVVICLAMNRVYNFLKMIFDGMVRNVNNKVSKFLMYPRDDSQGEAFPTISGLEAGQDRENIIKTSALPHDSTSWITSLSVDEGTQDLEISNLKARIKMLEEKDKGGAEPSGEDATIKGRSLETGEEAAVEKSTGRGSNDTEELINVLTSMDAVTILTSRVQAVSVPPVIKIPTVDVPTGSGLVPTASPIFTTASVKKKLQEQIDVHVAREMEEQMAREDQRRNEQIARDAKIARIHAEEELQMLIDGLDRNNKVITRHLHEYEQAAAELTIREKIELINELVKYQYHHAKILKYQAQQSKPLSKKQQREFYMSKQIKDFVPMASKEEGERMKRKGLREDLIQLWTLVKETLSIRQATSDKDKELWVELKSDEVPTASEERFPLLSKRDAPAEEVCTAREVKEDENPPRTLGDYSRLSHEGYRKTIEFPEGNNVVPSRFDSIRLVTAFCFKTKLRFASRPSAFCSRTHCDLSQEDSEDIQCVGSDHDHYQEAACAHHEEHVMHDCYVTDNEVPVIHSDLSYVLDDAFMMIYDDMCEPHDQPASYPSRNTVVKNSLTTELATYKEHVKL
nr:putative ribonuclease H-like domain-containing protein [Tanacetum cinerariifolium]